MVKSPVVLNAGLLRTIGRPIDTAAWYAQDAGAGQQLFYPPDVGGWDYTRWLDTATWRARWFIAALVIGTQNADRQPERPRAARPAGRRLLGRPDALAADDDPAHGLRQGAAEAQRESRRRRDGAVPPVATSPDLQTA